MPLDDVVDPVESILYSLSEDEIAQALTELVERDKGAELPDGTLKRIVRGLTEYAGLPEEFARSVAETSVLRQAALKWLQIRP